MFCFIKSLKCLFIGHMVVWLLYMWLRYLWHITIYVLYAWNHKASNITMVRCYYHTVVGDPMPSVGYSAMSTKVCYREKIIKKKKRKEGVEWRKTIYQETKKRGLSISLNLMERNIFLYNTTIPCKSIVWVSMCMFLINYY